MTLPAAYAFLETTQLPKMVVEALKLLGTIETPGAGNNPTIMAWAKETGVHGYSADSVPWCGLFMAVVGRRAGKMIPTEPLWALNWAKIGHDVGQPGLGDVLTFLRTGGGHVGLYIGEDTTHFHVLGGNQGDCVSIVRIEKKRLYRARRPLYGIGQPVSVQPYIIGAVTGQSTNEA